MKEIIESDFSVQFISENGPTALFGALRKGGTQTVRTPSGKWVTHVMGVWHLVLNEPVETKGLTRNQIVQWHIPRYNMALAIEQLRRVDSMHPTAPKPILSDLGEGISMALFTENRFGFALADGRFHAGLDQTFENKLKREVAVLQSARESVSESEDEFCIPDLRTPAGLPVKSGSRELIEAIAFERAVLGNMDAGNFGIYSAYCTQVDFDTTRQMPRDLIRSLIEEEWQHGDAFWQMAGQTTAFTRVQEMLFSKPIWGPDVNRDLEEAERILAAGMARLAQWQRVQFVLMNGMHGVGLLLPLCVLTNLLSFEEYVSIICRSFQADSPEEQDRRKETAFIKLFGQLAVKD